ncbi:MAG: hypothetical protein OXU45_03735 [Candidatus Melainabacteria bacterium]|nr:hypothetical protein [Candidatus Melainabacteria bacterium]
MRRLILLLLLGFLAAEASPYLPSDDETLFQSSASSKAKKVKKLAQALKAQPQNQELTYLVANQYLALGKAQADLRFYSYASAALEYWISQQDCPLELLLLEADIKQYEHKFEQALEILQRVLKEDELNQVALAMRAAIFHELGEYSKSNQDCRQLENQLLQTTCLALNQSILEPELAYQTLSRLEFVRDDASQWALTIAAEIAARLAKPLEAELYYRRAIAIDDHDVFLLGSYADFLLDQGEYRRVLELLADKQEIEILALRYKLAQSLGASDA